MGNGYATAVQWKRDSEWTGIKERYKPKGAAQVVKLWKSGCRRLIGKHDLTSAVALARVSASFTNCP